MLPRGFETPRLMARLPVAADAASLFEACTSKPEISRYMWDRRQRGYRAMGYRILVGEARNCDAVPLI